MSNITTFPSAALGHKPTKRISPKTAAAMAGDVQNELTLTIAINALGIVWYRHGGGRFEVADRNALMLASMLLHRLMCEGGTSKGVRFDGNIGDALPKVPKVPLVGYVENETVHFLQPKNRKGAKAGQK